MQFKKLKRDLTIWRKKRKISLRHIAEKMGYSPTHLYNVLRGKNNTAEEFWIMLEEVTGGVIKRGDYL